MEHVRRDLSIPKSVQRLVCCGYMADSHGESALRAAIPDQPVAMARTIAAHDRVTECVVLTTCNRVEIYASTRTPEDREAAVHRAKRELDPSIEPTVYEGRAVVEHLCRVACGLESKVIGEDHILGQVRDAFDMAANEELTKGILTRTADTAIRAGRTARAETTINEGHLNYGTAACGIIEETVPEPNRILLIGAGEIAADIAKAATHRWDPRIDVVNRSPATELCSDTGEFWSLNDLPEALSGADAVVTATGKQDPIITETVAAELAPNTPVIDLANPPDVADAVRANDTHPVTGLAAVQRRLNASLEQREQAIPRVEAEVEGAVERFLDSERESRAEDTIRALHRHAQTVREREFERALHQLQEGEADPEVVLDNFASALTGSLLADPTENLQRAARNDDEAIIEAVHQLFNFEE